MSQPEEVLLRKALAGTIAELAGSGRLTVVDLAAEGIVVWDLRRDLAGTPRGRSRPVVPWHELHAGALPPEQAVVAATRSPGAAAVVLACTFSGGRYNTEALDWLRGAHPEAPAFTCDTQLSEVLRGVIAHDPLTQWYELVTLTQLGSGPLELACCQLFPIGAQRGDTVELAVRCAPSDGRGTVFAVVSYSQERQFRPVSVQSVKVAPGRYDLTAELRRPGLVRFHGLPGDLARDDRGWSALVAAVPPRLEPPAAAAHLICAVEVSGAAAQVAERLSRIRQVITNTAAEPAGRLRVSLISYGPHSFDRRVPEVPVTVLTWADTAERALAELTPLEIRGGVEDGYPHAAQLECVLTEIVRRLGPPGAGDRTALLTVGERPAFPGRVHSSEILPCPARNDWEAALRRLRGYPGIAFGAICDGPGEPAGQIWRDLAGGRPYTLDAVDLQRLGESLGLAPSALQRVPFPLIETE